MKNILLQLFSFLFWPNPANATYSSPKAIALLAVCALLMALSIVISVWRKNHKNPVTRKLTRSWGTASFWFGLTGLILVVARVEQIQFVSMRVWWVLWLAIAIFFIFLQFKLFTARHYEVLPMVKHVDPREKYLPKRKK